MALVSMNDLEKGVQNLLLSVTGIHVVALSPGGAPGWVVTAELFRSYWEIHVPSIINEAYQIGTNARRRWQVDVKAWSPFSHEDPDTTPFWNDLIDAVQMAFIQNRTLRDYLPGNQVIEDAHLPNVPNNDWQMFMGEDQVPELVVTHYTEFSVTCQTLFAYTTR